MEEKKKISLSTFFLILAIIVICVMGFFLCNLKSNNDAELNSSKIENNITFSSLKGMYVGNAEVEPGTTPGGKTEVRLYLYENGCYRYNNIPGLGSEEVGYYTFNGDNLILHQIVAAANDIGRTIVSETITLKINNDNTIKDDELKAILKKSSDKIEEYDIISSELKTALNNNSLR